MGKKPKKMKYIILIYILYFINCVPPPKPDQPIIAHAEPPILMRYDNNTKNYKLLKMLDETNSAQFIETINGKINIEIDNLIQEQEIIISTRNMGESDFFPEYEFYLDVPSEKSLQLLSNACYKLNKDGSQDNDCIPSFRKIGNRYYFKYNYQLHKDEKIIINFTYQTLKDTKEVILYSEESVTIHKIYAQASCNYQVIISDRYASLGSYYRYFSKVNDNLFIYNDVCPYYTMTERFSLTLKESYWSGHFAIFYFCSKKLSGKAEFEFPREYRGGKNVHKYYKVMTLDNKPLDENSLIKDENNLKVSLKFSKKKKIGVHVHAIFSNKLDREFSVYLSEKFYTIGKVDEPIKRKALEIIGDTNSYYKDDPDYMKIGKYLYDNMHYDINYLGRDLSALQIFYAMTGVCEHFTILYNAMLNAIGIKTLKIYGWALYDFETFQDDTDPGHAWTAALINDTWMELDATWGRFEGIPAGHILKGFGREQFTYYMESKTILFGSKIFYSSKKQLTLIKDLDHFEEYYFTFGNCLKISLLMYILSILNLLI